MRKLEVILKLTEVCNIACTYCYYFLSGDERIADRPVLLQSTAVEGLCRFLNDAFHSGEIDTVQIDFHGGEPLMLGKRRFNELCRRMRQAVEPPLTLCVTTNGVLVDEDWIALFQKWGVNTCVSIDGTAEVHDRRRIDKKGKGTHSRAVEGFLRLKEAFSDGRIGMPAILCVVDPDSDAKTSFDYLVHELGATHLDFLMPDHTWDAPPENASRVAAYMTRLMDLWLAEDNPRLHIRTLRSVLSLLVSRKSYLAGFGSSPSLVMTVGSEGTIDTDDFLKPCGVDVVATEKNIGSASFRDVFDSPAAVNFSKQISIIPDDCLECVFAGVCRGGQATHRFSTARNFNNRSVYCEAQYGLFSAGARHLLRTGVATEVLAEMCEVA